MFMSAKAPPRVKVGLLNEPTRGWDLRQGTTWIGLILAICCRLVNTNLTNYSTLSPMARRFPKAHCGAATKPESRSPGSALVPECWRRRPAFADFSRFLLGIQRTWRYLLGKGRFSG